MGPRMFARHLQFLKLFKACSTNFSLIIKQRSLNSLLHNLKRCLMGGMVSTELAKPHKRLFAGKFV